MIEFPYLLAIAADELKSKLKGVDGILAIHFNVGVWPILN